MHTAHADEGKGNYALGIAGSDCNYYGGNSYGGAPKHVFVNCLFDRNFAEDRTGRSDVAPVLAEGLLASARTYGTICAAANCTFISATSANPSVALVGSKHYWPVNVVNCLFLSDAAIANPFYSLVPTNTIGLRAYSCTAQNCFTVPRNVRAEGWQTDWVPLVEDREKGSFPVAKVLTPGLRETADLAVTDYYVQGKNVQYRFKPYGSDAWQLLHTHSSSLVTTEPEALVADAVGDSRPKGEVTRGCVQSLTDQALTPEGEPRKAVILRREPFGAGNFDGAPSAQNVGALEQSVVTAYPIVGVDFLGWYNAAGDLVASTQEIDLSSFADGAILTAKFATKEVTVTFDLGQGGLFVDNNASTISYKLHEGDVFPKLPEYVESDEWLAETIGCRKAMTPAWGIETLVFDYATRTLNVPQPASDVQTPVWRVQYTSNAANAFSDSATSCATNALISGMTIACFSGSAINVTFNKSQTLVENCRFIGNSSNVNTGVVVVKGSLQMRNCDFRYNHGGVDFHGADDDRLSVVDDCTFTCNEIWKSRVFRYNSTKEPRTYLTSSNCLSEDNVYTAQESANSSIEFTTDSSRTCTISNGVVRNTRTCPLPKLGNAKANFANGHITLNGNFTFVRCRFEDNLLDYSTLSLGLSAQSAVLYQGGGNVLCRDCFFARNTVKSKNATNWDRPIVTSVAALHNGSMAFINCTLMDNFADAMESTTAAAATVGDRNEGSQSGLAFGHCTLANNTAQGGKAAADLLIHPDSENRNTTRHGIGILNSILHNSKDSSYKPLQLHAKMPPTILYSALSNIKEADFNTTADGALWEDVTDDTSGIAARISVSPDGVKALGIKSISPLTHGTDTIVISGNRPYLWNAEAANVNNTYLSLVEPTYYRNPSQVGRPDATQPAPLADAFGAPRIIGKLAVGALNAASAGFKIRVR